MTTVRFEKYSKSIRGRMVLNNIDCFLESGKVYKLSGVNGSGKTMLLRAISGLIYPDSGNLKVNDADVQPDVPYPAELGVLIENPCFWKDYSGFEILKYLASIKNEISDEEIKNSMRRMKLDPNDKRKVGKYSLGMRQKLGIIQAIMERPDIILLDEPLNALDSEGVEALKNVIYEEKERGALIILSLHNDGALSIEYDGEIKMEEGKLSED